MTDLIKALRAQVREHECELAAENHFFDSGRDSNWGDFVIGAVWENARLAPILERLIAVVEAAESYHTHSAGNGFHSVMQQKLADLRAAVLRDSQVSTSENLTKEDAK